MPRASPSLQEDPDGGGSEEMPKLDCEVIQSAVRAKDALLELLSRSRRCELNTMSPLVKRVNVFVREFNSHNSIRRFEMTDVNN